MLSQSPQPSLRPQFAPGKELGHLVLSQTRKATPQTHKALQQSGGTKVRPGQAEYYKVLKTLGILQYYSLSLVPINRLRVLQYNIQKSKDKIMAFLLVDKATALYNILALQELWQNPYKNTIYCLSLSVFYIVYNNQERRSCFLINKNLDINSWEIDYLGPDVYSL